MFLKQNDVLKWFEENLGLQVNRCFLYPALMQDRKDETQKRLVWYCQMPEEEFHVLQISGEYEKLTPLEFAQRILCKFCIRRNTELLEYSWGGLKILIGRESDGNVFFAE